jgi:signal transduction histidine kinase
MVKSVPEPQKLQIAPEILVPRIGDYLVEQGRLKDEELVKALDIQKELLNLGDYKLLGRILIEEDFIDQATLDAAITEQIVILQDALQKSNSELEQRVKDRTQELRKALNHITELNQLKTNFISNISHELRTPLAHMIGYLELLLDESLGPLVEDQQHALGVLLKSYDRLHGLIDELIQFSMLSQGEMSLSVDETTPNAVVKEIVSRAQSLASTNKITLTINNQADELAILADHEKISWVLGELIENGIKFNTPGGKVDLNIQSEDGIITFQISDDGLGIQGDRIDEIFEPFHQLDGSSTRRQGGTGIGLTLAKQIVEAHGSTLRVKSTKNEGTRFEFSLHQV